MSNTVPSRNILHIVNIMENFNMSRRCTEYYQPKSDDKVEIINFAALQKRAKNTITTLTFDDTEDTHYAILIVANLDDLVQYISKLPDLSSKKVYRKLSKLVANASEVIVMDLCLDPNHKNYISKCINDYNLVNNHYQDLYTKVKEYTIKGFIEYDDEYSMVEHIEKTLECVHNDKNLCYKMLDATRLEPRIIYISDSLPQIFNSTNTVFYTNIDQMKDSMLYDITLHKNKTFIIVNTCEQFKQFAKLIDFICSLHNIQYKIFNQKDGPQLQSMLSNLRNCTKIMTKYNVILVGPRTFAYDYYFNNDYYFNKLYSFIPMGNDSLSQCLKIKNLLNLDKRVHQLC